MPLVILLLLAFFLTRPTAHAQPTDAITVCSSGCTYSDLQKAINEAAPGSRIVLTAGQTYTGNFLLPFKGENIAPITIESSAMDQLPPSGFRIQPQHAEFMPKLVAGDRLLPVLRTGADEQYVERVDPATGTVFYGTNHGYVNGDPIAFWTDTALPPGMEMGKVYYVQVVSQTSLRLRTGAAPDSPAVRITGPFPGGRFRSNSVLAGHNYILRGLEFTVGPRAAQEYHLVEIGSTYAMVRQGISNGIELERVYIHGNPDQNGPRMCLLLNARQFTLRDSRLEFCNKEGEEGKGIGIVMAPGPGIIRNNYIEGGSINFLMGGDFVRIAGLVSGDEGGIEIFGNHFYKPLWLKYTAGNAGPSDPRGTCSGGNYLNTESGAVFYCDSDNRWAKAPVCSRGEYYRRADVAQNCGAGACWECGEEGTFVRSTRYRSASYTVKNLFEIKSGINIYVHGNVFENNWSNADQSGVGIWVVSQVAQGNADSWVRGENILFTNNILRNSSQGIRVASEGNTRFGKPNRNVRITNNLLYDIGATATPTISTGDARPISFAGECIDCEFSGNTVLSGVPGGTGVYFDTKPLTDFRFANNIMHANRYGMLGDRGLPLSFYLPGKSVLSNNIMLSDNPESARFAAGNNRIIGPTVPMFTDKAAKNFRLVPNSPFSAACTEKCEYAADNQRDLGADIDRVEQETSGAVSGTPSWDELFGLRIEALEATTASLSYYVRTDEVCTLNVSTNPSFRTTIPDVDSTVGDNRQSDNREGNQADGPKRTFLLGSIQPLTPDTTYFYKLQCASGSQSGSFKTKPAQ